MSSHATSTDRSASNTALISTGNAPTVPSSPNPLQTNGLDAAGRGLMESSRPGRSSARGIG